MIQKWLYKVNVNEALYMFVLPVAVWELISGYRKLFQYLKVLYQIEYKYMYIKLISRR